MSLRLKPRPAKEEPWNSSSWARSHTAANDLDLPDHDFWVFDSTQLVLMRFTADDRSLGHDLVTDPVSIARHEAWIDLAMSHATPWQDYLAEDRTRAEPPIRLRPEVTTGGP